MQHLILLKIQIGISSMVYKLFAKTSSGNGIRNENMLNQQLAGELNKQITRKFEKWKVHSPFIDNIWDMQLCNMQLISNLMKEFVFYYVLLIFIVNMCGFFL